MGAQLMNMGAVAQAAAAQVLWHKHLIVTIEVVTAMRHRKLVCLHSRPHTRFPCHCTCLYIAHSYAVLRLELESQWSRLLHSLGVTKS